MRTKLTLITVLFIGVVLSGGAAAGQPAPSPPPITTPPTTPSPSRSIDVKGGQGRPGLDYTVSGGEAEQVPAHAGQTSSRNVRVGPPIVYVTVPTLVTQPDGRRCLRDVRRGFEDPATAVAAANIRQGYVWRITEGGFLPCQDASTPLEPTPAQQAFDYWRVVGRDLLPKPAPKIAPGYMLAGKMAFLETGSQPTARFEHPTPAGTLVIEATSRLWVDWGDSSGLEGPHVGPGAPWPHGTITHFWTTATTYDVRVVQRWTATWTLGAATGTLDGLETDGVIDDFEVRQLQAVRNS